MKSMASGKKEIPVTNRDLKKGKKSRRTRLIYWLLIDISVAIIVFSLLMYRPGRYSPLDVTPDAQGQVSTYLTNELGSEINNKAQLGRPFDVEITQDGLNDIISHGNWPIERDGIMLYSPAAVLTPDAIVLMGTADMRGMEFIITAELKPQIDTLGLLNLQVVAVKVGAMNLTAVVKVIAKKMYTQRLAEFPVDTSDLRTKAAASLLNEEPFEPVFSIDNKRKLRIEKITLEKGRILAHLVPQR
jgi:hypothetical protein